MLAYFLPSLLLFIFGAFNILGFKPGLLVNMAVFSVIGVLLMIVFRKVGLHFFRINSYFFYWLFVGLLIITFIIGIEAKGSRRWIDLYFFNLQASEFFKIFFIIFFAEFFTRYRRSLQSFSLYLLGVLYFIIPTLIIFKQPDLGSAIVYVFIFLMMALFSSIPKKYLVYSALFVIVLLPLGWNFLHDYQRDRIVSFFNPHIDQQGNAYNMTQAIITVGSGNFVGRGLGLGTQSQLYFLPENHTDFAISSLIEQFGFMGGIVIIGLYMTLAYFMVKKMLGYYYQKDDDGYFKFLVLLGFLSFLIIQVFVNIGMNLGIMPITGITLPLISYGGSSLITWLIGIALLP